MPEKVIRVLLAKVGLDGHDRGINVIATWLRDAGMEVIYLGPFQTVDKVVKSAIAEDVDVIGLSFLGGEHLFYAAEIMSKMRENNLTVPLVIGGIIPKPDIPQLKQMGVKEVFPAGTPLETIVHKITSLAESGG
jgi:methylmalonyl-CoA mutase C-terminal domain/subunit